MFTPIFFRHPDTMVFSPSIPKALDVADTGRSFSEGDFLYKILAMHSPDWSLDWFSRENLNRKPWFLPSNLMGFPVPIFPSSNSMNWGFRFWQKLTNKTHEICSHWGNIIRTCLFGKFHHRNPRVSPQKVLPNNMGLKGPYFQYGLMVNTTNPLNNMGVSEKRGILPNSY